MSDLNVLIEMSFSILGGSLFHLRVHEGKKELKKRGQFGVSMD